MGAARGLDEGLIGTSAEQPSFQRIFGLDEASGKSEEEIGVAGLGDLLLLASAINQLKGADVVAKETEAAY